jgi:hypothetical protein
MQTAAKDRFPPYVSIDANGGGLPFKFARLPQSEFPKSKRAKPYPASPDCQGCPAKIDGASALSAANKGINKRRKADYS